MWRLRALCVALLAPPALEVFSLSRLVSLISRPSASSAPVDDSALAAWVDWILVHLPWPWRHTCLRRAVVLYALLRHAGRPVQLWIGVRGGGEAPNVTAHAWLTLGDTPYLERDAAHPGLHAPIARFPEGLPNSR